MKTAFFSMALLSANLASAQTGTPNGTPAPPSPTAGAPTPAHTNLAAKNEGPETPAPLSDLERHPYRVFGGKQCYLTSLLRWEQLDSDRRNRTPNPMPVWKSFHGSVVQLASSGSLLSQTNAAGGDAAVSTQRASGLLFQENDAVVFVKNLPDQGSFTNGQTVAFHAIRIPSTTYRYTSADGSERSVDAYDYGIPFHPRVAPLNLRTNLAALYRAQLIKSIDDQIASLETTDNRLREQELYLKRNESNLRQTRAALMREQYGVRQLQAQRAAIAQQINTLQKQKAQIEAASGSNTNASAEAAASLTNNAAAAVTNGAAVGGSSSGGVYGPGGANPGPYPNRNRNRQPYPGSP